MENYNCEHEHECRVSKYYPDLCYLNMSDKERRSLGGNCPIALEYANVPDEPSDLIAPSGLMRRIESGKSIKGHNI
jgi:hypothetical protein